MATDYIVTPRAGHASIRVDAGGNAWIESYRCVDCSAVLSSRAMACRSCGSRTPMQTFRVAESGMVYSWTVVHRSYPGIAVPFVSAIVDLEGGPTLKGNLRIDDPDTVRQGVRVRLVFDDAGGAHDKDGAPYVGFHFVPEGTGA
ncbi:MAG TPA: OB-fold domain-containing protein [Sphingobium sp.]|uniref:Zn-ribbon domain-containing OB-fold protein n=1 Tax=Sphingobium sp. TaxID=1912891 RepID=UPI002ED652E6